MFIGIKSDAFFPSTTLFRFSDIGEQINPFTDKKKKVKRLNFIMTDCVRKRHLVVFSTPEYIRRCSSIRQTSPCWSTWACACRWVCTRTRCCWSCSPTGSGPSCCSCSTSPATPSQTAPPLWTEGETRAQTVFIGHLWAALSDDATVKHRERTDGNTQLESHTTSPCVGPREGEMKSEPDRWKHAPTNTQTHVVSSRRPEDVNRWTSSQMKLYS